MRILVYEFVSAGGFGDRDVPASLAREGAAMLGALTTDLVMLRQHTIVTTIDPRFNAGLQAAVPRGVRIVATTGRRADLDALFASVDAVWLVAPEIDGSLARLAERVERQGTRLLGSGARAIRRAADKSRLANLLARNGIPCPDTRVARSDAQCCLAARALRYPLVVKPARGAGCIGVRRVSNARGLDAAVTAVRRMNPRSPVVLQEYMPGIAVSVSLLSNGRSAAALSMNRQFVRAAGQFSYRGGQTPYNHPLAAQAMGAAVRACESVPGLKGYIGVDLVLTRTEAMVIEINPRLTTAYLGVSRALRCSGEVSPNVAELALDACDGILGASPPLMNVVRFSADGRTVVRGMQSAA